MHRKQKMFGALRTREISLPKYPRLWGKLGGRFGKTRAAWAMLRGRFMPGPGRGDD